MNLKQKNILLFGILSMLNACTQNLIPQSTDVEMVQEWVSIKYQPNGQVLTRVDYNFSGDISEGKKLAFPETEWFELENFKATFNNQPLIVKKEFPQVGHLFYLGKNDFTALHVFNVPSFNGMSHRSHNSYSYMAPYYGPGTKSGIMEPEGVYIEYILVTGAPWSKTIGGIEVVFESGMSCEHIYELASSYKGNCNNGVWKFVATNIEPDRNIRLVLTKYPINKITKTGAENNIL